MTRLVDANTYHTMLCKAYAYDSTIEPITDKYEAIITGYNIVVIILVLMLIGAVGFAWFKHEQCKYYRNVLKQNVGGW